MQRKTQEQLQQQQQQQEEEHRGQHAAVGHVGAHPLAGSQVAQQPPQLR